MLRRELLTTGLAALTAGQALLTHQALANTKLGAPAPDFSITPLSGPTLSSADLRGKVVILNFWATWCQPCRTEMPAFEAYYKAHQKEGLEILAVSQDEASLDAKVSALASALSFPVALARKCHTEGFGRIWQLPISFVIDREGRLRADGSQKPIIFDEAKLDQLVSPLLRKK